MLRDLPDGLPEALADAVGPDRRVASLTRVGGGDINNACVVSLEDGARLFLKWNEAAPPGMFEAEADGLAALRAAAGTDLIVPGVRALGQARDTAWLLMEHVDTGPRRSSPSRSGWATRLGRGIAAMHRGLSRGEPAEAAPTLDRAEFGWARDNFIGRLPQSNAPTGDWAAFWRDRRVGPQVKFATDAGLLSGAALEDVDRLLDRIPEALVGADADGPSLLHGDLWSGNAYSGPQGNPVLIDPAVYRGHREVDLAMTELFGGFPARFYDAYHEAWPVSHAYHERRRDCYQLYYLLVHVNLFGRGYVAGTMERARRLGGA